MDKSVLTFIGGCHVAGYLVEKSTSFVDHLNGFFAPQRVHRMAYAKIEDLTQLLEDSQTTEATVVFLQLGNFEFSASWKQILATTTGLPAWVPNVSAKSKGLRAQPPGPASMASTSSHYQAYYWLAGNPIAEAMKTAVGAGLYVFTWLVLRKHRRQFRALNQLIAQNPRTTFVCMSPFPSTAGTHNALRRLGGWIMQQRLQARSNLRWVDTHRVLHNKTGLFGADGIHLNEYGHRVLAQHLQTVCLAAAA